MGLDLLRRPEDQSADRQEMPLTRQGQGIILDDAGHQAVGDVPAADNVMLRIVTDKEVAGGDILGDRQHLGDSLGRHL